MILEVIDDGAFIGRDHETFVIRTKEKKLIVPAKKLDSINISSNATISTAAIRLCLKDQINLVISNKSGRPEGRIWYSIFGKNSETKRRQYINANTSLGIKISQEIVRIKVKKQYLVAYAIWKNRVDKRKEIYQYLKILKSIIYKLNTIDNINKPMLLGLEGAAANAYFSIFKIAIPARFDFKGRNQFAKDPINSILNYLYGICYREIESGIIITGLDPNSGFYHSDQYGKPVLSFDLIEVFRPEIDKLLLYLIAKKKIKQTWFIKEESGLLILNKDARKTLINEYYLKLGKHIKSETFKLCFWIIGELNEQK